MKMEPWLIILSVVIWLALGAMAGLNTVIGRQQGIPKPNAGMAGSAAGGRKEER